MKKETLIGIVIFLALLCSAVYMTGILEKEGVKETQQEAVFEKSYMVSRYPIAGEDGYLYVVDFQFDNVEELVEWLQKYEQLRRKEDVKIRNEENAGN